jgi:hypothetical protein
MQGGVAVSPVTKWSDKELSEMLLSELGPVIGEQVFKQLHARKKARGREKNSNVNYRALAAKWDAFRSYQPPAPA